MSQETPIDFMVWLRAFRHRSINLLLGSVAVLGTAGILYIVLYRIPTEVRLTPSRAIYLLSYLVVVVLYFGRRIPDRWRALGFLTLLYGFSVFSFVGGWLGSSARTFLLTLIILAAILVSTRASLVAAGLSLVTYAGFGLAYNRGWLVYPEAPAHAELPYIIIEGFGFALAVGMTTVALWAIREGLMAATRANQELREARALLDQRAQELNAANRLLEERSSSLAAANEELESFTYSVSHDLRAPLRAMDGFSRMLSEDYAPQLPAEAQRYLGKVRANAQKMTDLIDGLLSLSRLGRQSLRKRSVKPEELVHQVLEELSEERTGRRVDILVGELPPCQADPTLLKQVYANLLSNALKYTRDRDRARIDVGCEEVEGVAAYYVRDNGTGFDMTYADRLFALFQRMHSEGEYEGSGVGLAIVQRIVHRHGGEVWAEGEEGRGATFYFTLAEGTRGK